ncbi:hypothetical protein FRC12_007279 [Ceratobasidium sp. 428]|nr:hypothetical protein FRC12_007279 [Ceratobasidium sp. 428]
MNPSFIFTWKVEGHQQGLITCLAISPKGSRLIATSNDHDLLLVAVGDGHVAVKLSFEGQFSVLTAIWCSESNVLCGACNGSLYIICFDPTNNDSPVTMTPFLTPFNQQIRSLAFDPTRHLLAVGHSNTVSLFIHDNPDRHYTDSNWRHLEMIKGPCNNESGLVHGLLFYPTEKGTKKLLILYAESGWNVWSDVSAVKRISPDTNHNVCRVGRAVLTADDKALAVSTLDRTIVLYDLGDDGPVLTTMREFPYNDDADYSPIVPVASTPGGLTLGGTTCGELPVIDGHGGNVSLMRHEGSNHLIRAIAVHGDKIIVGSSNWAESIIKCYSSSPIVSGKKDDSPPNFVTVTEALSRWNQSDSRWEVVANPKYEEHIIRIRKSTGVWAIMIAMTIVLILSADPPSGHSFKEAGQESDTTDLFKPNFRRHNYWVLFGVRHFFKYFMFQCAIWFAWMMSATYKVVVSVGLLVPHALDVMTMGIAKWICEFVEVYRELGVCPRMEY